MERFSAEVAVIGGGPAGLTAAIALAAAGVETALVARAPPADNRTTALLVRLSRGAGSARGLVALRRAFRAADRDPADRRYRAAGPRARGHVRRPPRSGSTRSATISRTGILIAALDRRAAALPNLRRIAAAATAVQPDDHDVTITLDSGATLTARLVVGADGRKSLCRAAAGIETERRDYPQVALTLNLGHARPHHGISTEFHTETGPFTLVPLPGLRASLVCVVDPAQAEELRRSMPARSRPRSSAGRTRSSARSRSAMAATSFRSASRPRAPSGASASRWSAKPRM